MKLLLMHGRFEDLVAGACRLGMDQDEGYEAGLSSTVDPVVDGASLDQDVPCFEMYDAFVQFHVDLPGYHDGVVYGVGSMHHGRVTRAERHDSEDGAVGMRDADLARSAVLIAGLILVGVAGHLKP